MCPPFDHFPSRDYTRLAKSFFQQDTDIVAQNLIGSIISCRTSDGFRRIVRITETEAYLSENDPACHAARRQTARNTPMFADGGILYVYFVYGMHWCANVVTEIAGRGCAVLFRSAIPLVNVKSRSASQLTPINGPGRLAKHLGLDGSWNFVSVLGDRFQVFRDDFSEHYRSLAENTTRVGISVGRDLLLRWVVNSSSK